MIKISADKAKCKGQHDDGTMVCAYRGGCLRYVAPANENHTFEKFYTAGDDCPQYLSVPKLN